MTGDRWPLAANVSLLFTELPLLARFNAARDAGFGAVECWWPFGASAYPSAAEVDRFVDAVRAAGLPLLGMNLFAGDMPAGQRGVASVPGRRAEFDASVEIAAEIANRTDLAACNALYGQRIAGVDPERQDAAAIDALSAATERLSSVGVTVLVEPLARGLNGDYPLQTAGDCVAVVGTVRRATGRESIGVLFDTFHLAMNGADLCRDVDELGALTAHVQLADAPGRGEPGSGAAPIFEALDRLWEAGYRGAVAAEYQPAGATLSGLGWVRKAPHLALAEAAP